MPQSKYIYMYTYSFYYRLINKANSLQTFVVTDIFHAYTNVEINLMMEYSHAQ